MPVSMSSVNDTNSGGALSRMSADACSPLPLVMARLSSPRTPSIVLAEMVM